MSNLGKPLKIGLLTAGFLLLSVATIFGAIWISHIETHKAEAAYPPCQGTHTARQVTISNDQVNPGHTQAKRCDTLTITNLDDMPRIIAFGPHDHHVAYDGVTERYLSKEGRFTVTLIQPGSFSFHDHDQQTVNGTFTVTAE